MSSILTNPSTRRQHFSLIEIVAVMIVMTILLAFATPAVSQALRGTGVDIAAKEIGTQLYLARQYAQANRRYCAVIMPGPNAEDAKVRKEYMYGCSRIAFVSESNNSWVWDEWVDSSEWRFTPEGITIMEADNDMGIYNGSDNKYVLNPYHDDFTTVDKVELGSIGEVLAAQDDIRAIIFSPAGRVKGKTLCITVGDAIFDGVDLGSGSHKWIIKKPATDGDTNTNQSCKNQVTVQVNRFTGGSEYRQPIDY